VSLQAPGTLLVRGLIIWVVSAVLSRSVYIIGVLFLVAFRIFVERTLMQCIPRVVALLAYPSIVHTELPCDHVKNIRPIRRRGCLAILNTSTGHAPIVACKRRAVADLDRLQEIEVEQDGKHFILRTPVTGVAGKAFQAVGAVLPPNIREAVPSVAT
jgi:hypothetical protein